MRAHIRAAAVTGISAVLLSTAACAVAAESAAAAGPVPWSAAHATASASGERWTEGTGPTRALVIKGKLSNSAEGCYSLWTKFNADLVPGVPRKQAELCGPGGVPVEVRRSHSLTTTGSLTVCKGTANTNLCGPWQSVTSWPVTGPR